MKKLLAIALIVAFAALCFAGCAGKPTVTPVEPTVEPSAEPAGDPDQEAADAVAALIDAIRAARPAALKGQLFKKISLSSTMGVPVKIDIKD